MVEASYTWYRFFELELPPTDGLPMSFFSPIFREPSFTLEEVAVKGSGADKVDNFCLQG
jgi:hypothetical protein